MHSKVYYDYSYRMSFAANVAPVTISNPEHTKSKRRL